MKTVWRGNTLGGAIRLMEMNDARGEEHSIECPGCRDEKYVLNIRFASQADRDLIYKFMQRQDEIIDTFTMNKSTEGGTHETDDESNR